MKIIPSTFFIIGVFTIVLSISSIVYASDVLINVNNLNVRSGPGTEYETITQVDELEQYEVIKQQGDWVEIRIGEKTGWVTKEFITLDDEINSTSSEETKKQRILVLYDQTNIRNQPSTDGDIIGSVDKSKVLKVSGKIKEWFKIDWEGKDGFIPSSLVDSPTALSPAYDNEGIKDKTIVIDAGHGGRDVGAIGASGNYEKHYTLKTAYKLKNYLETLGAHVSLTRSNDNYLSLSGRTSLSNAVMADVFISIHYNSTPQYPGARGVSTYYYSENEELLAQSIQSELLQATDMEDRGIHEEDFHVTRTNHRPSVLLELGFISNIQEEQNIQSSAFQEKIAQGIISGLDQYFKK